MDKQPLPDIPLHTAVSSELVFHKVCVVGGGNEVMAQGLAHVLVNTSMLRVKDAALFRAKVH